MQAQRWRRCSPQNVVRLKFGRMKHGQQRRRDKGDEDGRRKIERRRTRTVAVSNPMASVMQAMMRPRHRQVVVEPVAISRFRHVVRVMDPTVTGTLRLEPRLLQQSMIATTEYAMREQVQPGQDGDELFHDRLPGFLRSSTDHSLYENTFREPMQFPADRAARTAAVLVVFSALPPRKVNSGASKGAKSE